MRPESETIIKDEKQNFYVLRFLFYVEKCWLGSLLM